MRKNKTKPTGQCRQGDVLTIPVTEIPAGLKKTKTVTLANGEATGHNHTINGGAVGFADEEDALVDYFEVTKEDGVDLVHQEHGPIQHKKGTYRNVRQSEYTPEKLRRVAD
jgi:hypothetical protein